MGVEVKSGGEGVIVAAIQAGAPVGVQSVVHW